MTTPATKAPLEGEITVDSLNPPHGKITGSITLPPLIASLAGLVEIREVIAGVELKAQQFAVLTYERQYVGNALDPHHEDFVPVANRVYQFLTIHLGPRNTPQKQYQNDPSSNWELYGGYLIHLK